MCSGDKCNVSKEVPFASSFDSQSSHHAKLGWSALAACAGAGPHWILPTVTAISKGPAGRYGLSKTVEHLGGKRHQQSIL